MPGVTMPSQSEKAKLEKYLSRLFFKLQMHYLTCHYL